MEDKVHLRLQDSSLLVQANFQLKDITTSHRLFHNQDLRLRIELKRITIHLKSQHDCYFLNFLAAMTNVLVKQFY